jgi:hypothetical protein
MNVLHALVSSSQPYSVRETDFHQPPFQILSLLVVPTPHPFLDRRMLNPETIVVCSFNLIRRPSACLDVLHTSMFYIGETPIRRIRRTSHTFLGAVSPVSVNIMRREDDSNAEFFVGPARS